MGGKRIRKNRLCGNIYDFVVDYEKISGDMQRYLMIKHNIIIP